MLEMVGKYIFFFNIGASLLNLLIAIVARNKTKNKEFNDLIFYWASVIFSFIAAAALMGSPTQIAFSYFFQVLSINLMARMLWKNQTSPYPWKLCAAFQIPGMIVSAFLLLYTDAGFTYSLMPLSFSLAVSYIVSIWRILVTERHTSSWIEKSLAYLYITCIAHIFNFAIFRLDPSAAMWGWSISIAQYQFISVFLPLLIYHSRDVKEKKNLQTAIGHITGSEISGQSNINIDELYNQLETQITQKEEALQQLKLSNENLQEEREVNEILIKTISHDLANPLTVINAYTDLLSSNRVPEADVPRTWGRLKTNIEASLNMISRIRNAVLKRNQGNLVQIQNVLIDQSIQKSMELFEARFQEKDIECLYTNSTPTDTCILAEETSLVEHVLANILSNAVKFSRTDSKILIKVFDAQKFIGVEVRDFGIGIDQHRLTKKLLQSTEGTHGETGTGFGMIVMNYFLRRFDGKINVASETIGENMGTTVTIYLKKSIQ